LGHESLYKPHYIRQEDAVPIFSGPAAGRVFKSPAAFSFGMLFMLADHQKNVLLIAAAGRGKRLGAEKNKVYLPLKGKPLLAYTIEVFLKTDLFPLVGVIIAPGEEDIFCKEIYTPFFSGDRRIFTVAGGAERQVSVFNGLKALKQKEIPEDAIVCIHDGARPLVKESLIREVCREALLNGAAITGVPLKDTIKEVDRGLIVRNTPPREQYMAVQTPQCFKFSVLWQAHEKAAEKNYTGSDDSTLVEHLGVKVTVVPGSYENLKITTPFDLRIAEVYLAYKEKEAYK
jgi:2-C-methyl-D-erythritol 4-phosphate cytidylyltransferase